MGINTKKIKNVIEYIIVILIMFMGLRKGGYYKEDSLVITYIIQLIIAIYLIISYREIKINRCIAILLVCFTGAYFIPIIINNCATVSGALSFASRLYSVFLLYIIICNSQNKEKYIKAVIVFTIICGIFVVDEATFRLFNLPLNFIGGGYVEERESGIATIFQYSNLLGILCTISCMYLTYSLKEKSSNYPKILKYVSISFLTTIMLFCHSKMTVVLYIIAILYLQIKDKKFKNIIIHIINLMYSIIIVGLAEKYFAIIIILSLIPVIVYFVLYELISKSENKKRYLIILNVVCILLVVGLCLIFCKNLLNSKIIISVKDYFQNFYSTKLRFVYYKDALKIITSSPINFIFGSGGNAFRTLYETVQESSYVSLETHGLIIQIFLESGIIGLGIFIALIVYVISKAKNEKYRNILIITLIFATFDVFFTYTFMLYVLIILIALCDIESSNTTSKFNVINLILYIIFLVINTTQTLALFIEPITVNDLNVSVDYQEKNIKRCEMALKLDPYDLDYMRKYNTACVTYLDILDIKQELYGIENKEERKKILNNLYNNIQNENKFEKSNKYAIEDSVYYVYKYLDEFVSYNYEGNESTGYEEYLIYMLDNIQRLRNEHGLNEYSMDVYNNCIDKLFVKYSNINTVLNNNRIEDILDNIKENEYLSL